jgi:hypothetical protein
MRVILLIVIALALLVARPAAAVPFEEANNHQKLAAQKTFEAADGLYRAGRFDEALTAFRASHEIVASANTRLMFARCLLALDRLLEARAEFLGTINDAGKGGGRYKQAQAAARAELGSLNERLAFVTITVTGEASAKIDDRELAPEEFGVALPALPGTTLVVATWTSGKTERRELALAAGAFETVDLQEPQPPPQPARPAPPPAPPPPPPRSSAPRTLAYVASGVGLAGLATFTVFGLMNNSTYASLEEACEAGSCPADRADDIDSGRTYQTVANVGLAVGIVGLGTGATLFLLSSDSGSEQVSARLSPSSVTVSGRF